MEFLQEGFWKLLASEEVQKILLNGVLLLVGLLGKYWIQFWHNKVKNEKVQKAGDKIYDFLVTELLDNYKSASEDFRRKAKDGNFTAEEREEWRKNIVNTAELKMKAEINELKLAGKDIQKTVLLHAEAAWMDIKQKFFR